MKYTILFLSSIILLACQEKTVRVELVPVEDFGHSSSMRGLYKVNDNVVWSSGTNGVTKRTINNKDWESFQDTSLSHLDFRDIHAFSKDEAIIMSSGDGCEMYKTTNGAKTWELVYQNKTEGVFFDGMDFWDDKDGIAFSDPIRGKLVIIQTNNGGKSWTPIDNEELPEVLQGEAGFAASGTGIQCIGDSMVVIGTGGAKESRIFISKNRGKSWKVFPTKMRTGQASGIYSLFFTDEYSGWLAGGNYLDSTSSTGNYNFTKDGGKTWVELKNKPNGYKSCISGNNKGDLISCGRTGVDFMDSKTGQWKKVSENAYYSCILSNKTGWLIGKNRLAKITIKPLEN